MLLQVLIQAAETKLVAELGRLARCWCSRLPLDCTESLTHSVIAALVSTECILDAPENLARAACAAFPPTSGVLNALSIRYIDLLVRRRNEEPIAGTTELSELFHVPRVIPLNMHLPLPRMPITKACA